MVRRARPGERLETLDHVVRDLDPDDILITDSSGPISMAGTMGGLATEISDASTNLVIEAAHFDARAIARESRRHKLFSEASYRFERGVDRELPLRASAKAVALLAELGGGTAVPGCTHAQVEVPQVSITMAVDYPDKVAGTVYGRDAVLRRLHDVGCEVSEPASRPQEPDPASGTAPASGGARTATSVMTTASMTAASRCWRSCPRPGGRTSGTGGTWPKRSSGWKATRTSRAHTAGGGRARADRPAAAPPRHRPFPSLVRLRRSDQPAVQLRRRLRPAAAARGRPPPPRAGDRQPAQRRRAADAHHGAAGPAAGAGPNIGRGFTDVGLFETGHVFLQHRNGPRIAPILRADRGPSVQEVATMEAALPEQPQHIAAVVTGERELDGWWGKGRPAAWQDAVEAARQVLRDSRVPFRIRADQAAPWHPGRCAAVFVQAEEGQDWLAGYAGELHPRVIAAFGLPPRTSAMELDLSVIESAAAALGPVEAPVISPYPVATQDVALLVPEPVPADEVESALVEGVRGSDYQGLLEEVRLFDVYTGEQAGPGRKSLAYTLRFRAPDRTLTVEETTAARDAAVEEAVRRVGAVLRGPS